MKKHQTNNGSQRKTVFEATSPLGKVSIDTSRDRMVIKVTAETPEMEAQLVSMVMLCVYEVEHQRALHRVLAA